MPLLYHTTEYKPERAQAEISRLLLSVGARRISQEYDERRRVVGMSFQLDTARGPQEFLLPVRSDRVQKVMARQGILRGAGRRSDPALQREHAESVAWRTMLEWLKVQLAIIETDQAQAAEVMLPYMLVERSPSGAPVSVFEQYSSDRALPAPSR